MNNNRGNNRRRGRGNNRQQGGGQPQNRIDSRARGNAPQLLEKYRKLAHDAHLNGDRVTEEYYLQFADHYFRVIADTRARQEEQRIRRDERWQEGNAESDREDSEDSEGGSDSEYSAYDQSGYGHGNGNGNRREREDRPRRQERAEPESRNEASSGDEVEEKRSPYEPPENPFVRDSRATRGPKTRRPRREEPVEDSAGEPQADAPGIDPDLLPPAISAPREEAPAPDKAPEADKAPKAPAEEKAAADKPEAKPRRRTTRRKPAAGDTGETLESVNQA